MHVDCMMCKFDLVHSLYRLTLQANVCYMRGAVFAQMHHAHLCAVGAPVNVLLKSKVFQVAINQMLLQLSEVGLKDLQKSLVLKVAMHIACLYIGLLSNVLRHC